MPIPAFQSLMLPVLVDLSGGRRTNRETADGVARACALTQEDIQQTFGRNGVSILTNRIAWAKAHLKVAGLIESVERGVWRLTERGRKVVLENPPRVDHQYLKRFPEWQEYMRERSKRAHSRPDPTPVLSSDDIEFRTPDETIEAGAEVLRSQLRDDLRDRIASMSPGMFEHLVVDLLIAMGYGGPQVDAGLVTGRGGDGGIDGVISEDRLGLRKIYVQAKLWQGNVGRPEIQRFNGALQGVRSGKGVFITSSAFTREAVEYARTVQTPIVLIDGEQLADLMIDHDVGVATARTITIKRIDSDYFELD